MGPLAGQLLLESLILPFVLAGLAIASTRMTARGPFVFLVQALAIFLAVGTTYVLAFGWPPAWTSGARTKIMLSGLFGLAAGIAVERQLRWSAIGLIAGAIAVPIWIGLPALRQGNAESVLLLLPIAAALAAWSLVLRSAPSAGMPRLLMLLIVAVGAAAIAALSRTLSIAELSLALGAALFAILIVGRAPLTSPATLMAAAMIQALITALLLYSEASVPALIVLGSVMGAEHLARRSSGDPGAPAPILRVLIFCLLPATAAIVIARIDAGPISIY